MPGDYWFSCLPTYIENWPIELQSLSIAQVDVPLTLEEAEALGSNMTELREMFPQPWGRPIHGIRDRVDAAVRTFRSGAFVRLGSRSPKDSWYGSTAGFRCADGDHAMSVLLGISERVMEDLLLCIEMKYAPHIFLREWLDLARWQEFRCFMKDRKLVGISQYHYFDGPLQQLSGKVGGVQWAIERFFQYFQARCHVPNVVFDVAVFLRSVPGQSGSQEHTWKVKLIEINPFMETTDPCLFSWTNGGDFDGSIRIAKPSA